MSAGNPFLTLPDAPQQGQSGNPFDSLPDVASKQPGFLDRDIPLTDHWNATLSGIQSIGRGVRDAATGAYQMVRHPIDTTVATAKGVANLPNQVSQVPATIRDINQSPDPTGTYAKVAQDTAGQGAGQALLALGTEGLVKGAPAAVNAAKSAPGALGDAAGAVQRTFSKGAVTREMGSKLSASLDRVAADAGLPPSAEASLSAKTADVVHGLKKQAQADYSTLDQASGGRYQRFVDEIDDLQSTLRNKYLSPDDAAKVKTKLADTQKAYSDMQQQMITQGTDPAIIARADAKWAQAKALEQVGKKFRNAETLSGDLKPGTPSVDTGLKNLKPHILSQATKGEAPAITDTVTSATKSVRNVSRNRKIAAGAGAVLGLSGAAKYGSALMGH